MFREKFSQRTYAVEPIPLMNEIFVSGPPKPAKVGITSDSTFTTRHNDGPYSLLPFCSTYRCILGLDSSARFTTSFTSVPDMSTTCRTGDIVCFDFNREVHYIVPYANAKQEQAKLAPEDGGDGHRIALKVRFIVVRAQTSAHLTSCLRVNYRNTYDFRLEECRVSFGVIVFAIWPLCRLG